MMSEKYTDEIIERYLKQAIEDSTPDILEDLIAEIQMEPSSEEEILEETASELQMASPARRRRKWHKALAGCAAAVMIFAGAFTILQKNQNEVVAFVDLDVNPSVELSVNRQREIVKTKALNEDGRVILADMDLEGTDVNVACNALIGSMVKQGYLTELSNSVLVSVRSEDDAAGMELEHMISGNLHDSIDNSEIAGAVMGQYINADQELEAFASENAISLGKSWLIKKLMETNSRHMTEESLLKLSTQELILLSQKRNVQTDDSYGKADASKYISGDEAKSIALQYSGCAGVDPNRVTAEMDCDDGIITYEVEFESDGQEYEYDINAETGEVIEHEIETDNDDDADDDVDDDDDVEDGHEDDGDHDDDDNDDDDDDNDHDDDDHDDDEDDDDDD